MENKKVRVYRVEFCFNSGLKDIHEPVSEESVRHLLSILRRKIDRDLYYEVEDPNNHDQVFVSLFHTERVVIDEIENE